VSPVALATGLLAVAAAGCAGHPHATGAGAAGHATSAPHHGPAAPAPQQAPQQVPVAEEAPQASAPADGDAAAGAQVQALASAPGPGCLATVVLANSWPGGFQGAVTIKNVGDKPMKDWYVQWTMPMEAKITEAWQGTSMQSGPIAMIHAESWNKVLEPGATITGIGFVGSAPKAPAFTEVTCG
jgi:cellulase/cellobiase CelA1